MLNKDIKSKVLKEKKLDNALKILGPYKNLAWDKEIIEHLQKITPNDEIPIDDFSYMRKKRINL